MSGKCNVGGERSDVWIGGSRKAYLTWEINFDGLDANVARTRGHGVDMIVD